MKTDNKAGFFKQTPSITSSLNLSGTLSRCSGLQLVMQSYMFAGNGLLIWKFGDKAGIYALAEFISPVDIFAPDASLTTTLGEVGASLLIVPLVLSGY